MIKNFLVSLVLLFSVAVTAQTGTSSIYSFYGIGDMAFKGSLENRLMGGVGVFSDSIHINLQNPASFAGLSLTTFTLGASNSRTGLKTDNDDSKANRSSLDYLAVGVPISSKFGAGFGLMPYSSVGYKVIDNAENETETNKVYTGSGGLNKVFFDLGYKLTPKFNIGVELNYNFGEITTTGLIAQGVQFSTREISISNMAGISATAGMMFQSKLKNKMDVFASLAYTPQTILRLGNERTIATVISTGDGDLIQDEQELYAPDVDLKMPSKISFGGGIGIVRKWLVGTEITFRQSSDFANRFTDIQKASFENSQKYSVGGYYIPNWNSFTSYFERITYRGGLRYETTGLVINGKSIEDKAVTFGLGLPLRGTFSNVNIGVELGRRGTRANNLVEETYHNFSISLSLNDKWFVKRKYD